MTDINDPKPSYQSPQDEEVAWEKLRADAQAGYRKASDTYRAKALATPRPAPPAPPKPGDVDYDADADYERRWREVKRGISIRQGGGE